MSVDLILRKGLVILDGKEIDILIHSLYFGIDYNGLMWHSIGSSKYSMFNNLNTKENKNKHLVKTNLADKKGFQLYHIFENEWLNPIKKSIWLSVIRDKLNLNKKIGARKCEIVRLKPSEHKEFCDTNHLQGRGISNVNLGLLYNDKIVSLMTFSKSRFSKEYQYELIRFCSKKGMTIQGGASRLFAFFVRTHKPTSIVSYANRRWSQGNLYHKLGFELKHISAPNYFYFNPKEETRLYSRNKYQKHKLKKELKIFDQTKTEWENMDTNGYRKIYDSGNYVFTCLKP